MNLSLTLKTQLLWFVRTLIIGAAFVAAECWLLYPSKICGYAAAATAILTVFVGGVALPLFIRSYKISVKKGCLVVTKGIIIRNTDIMPFPRLVFGAGYRTPLARLLKLEGVVLRAARGLIIIPEMKRNDAQYLLNTLSGEQYEK